MPHNRPAAPAVLDALKRTLASETFGRSERARKLLRYLVEQEQAGHADRLKGFTIAIDVFGRDADFDSSADAVVRVQARRLRELLKQYAETEGADDPIRIVIARGSYVPTYEIADTLEAAPLPAISRREQATSTQPPKQPASTAAAAIDTAVPAAALAAEARVMRHLRYFWAAMTVVIAMLGFVIFRMHAAPGEIAMKDASSTPTGSIAIPAKALALPTVYIKPRGESADIARVAAVLRTGLSGFDTIGLIARDPSTDADTIISPLQFVFEVSPGSMAGSVTIDLENSVSGRVLLSRVLAPEELDADALDNHIADLLSATIPVSGALYGYLDQNRLASGLVECLLLNNHYYLDPTPQKHEAAYRCFSRLADGEAKSPLVYAELAVLVLKSVTEGHRYPRDASPNQALTLAHRAVLTGPNSPCAHRAYGFANSRVGDPTEAIRFMRKAYELNTYDLSMAAAYGYVLVFSGNYQTAAPIIERAVEASSAHPGWWDYALFLAEFMIGDTDRASRATEALMSTKKAHYLAARLIAAGNAGNAGLADSLANEIVTDFPSFAADPRQFFETAKYPSDLVDRLVTTLRASGLADPS
ncbi:tetratricopeptide repeat protein [Mesorhizobium sp. KR1-2]|uniref:tetratricopeptide repeat protein n=1 Tax=Mesorhizobium sp. KR1-2 TaxID=3156609 RepID=UPI0032B40A6E